MDSNELERELIQSLTENDFRKENEEQAALRRLPHKTEIRIHTAYSPVREETTKYRQIARELDDRYDKYMNSNEGSQR